VLYGYMQHQVKWKNWPVLLLGVVFVLVLIFLAHKSEKHFTATMYLTDVASAITAIIISIATYDEWERRQERKRYKPPENLGLKRVKNEVFQLLYIYAFIFDDGFRSMAQVTKIVKNSKVNPLHKKLQIAKRLSESELTTSEARFKHSIKALKAVRLKSLVYKEAFEVVKQTEETVRRLDIIVATYGYSFMPEIHNQVLMLREKLNNALADNLHLIAIRFNASSPKAGTKLSKLEITTMQKLVDEIISIGELAHNLKGK
jgi:heme/copper-type cytochrome/quinol oxidase subunit 2